MSAEKPRTQSARAAPRALTALAFGHAATDLYMGFIPALLPVIMATLGLDYKAAGGLATSVGLTSSLAQPLLGFIGDRFSRRNMAMLMPALAGLAMCTLGYLHSYLTVVSALIIAALASSMFHPHGAALVNMMTKEGSGKAMALFTAGGNVGYGVGSVTAALVVMHLGLQRTWVTLPAGLAAAAFLMAGIPRSMERRERQRELDQASAPPAWRSKLVVLFGVVMLRAASVTIFTTFVPVLMARRGEPLILGGSAIMGFTLAGAAAGFYAGHLAETVGRRLVTAVSFALACPAFWLFLHADGVAAAGLLLLTGGCLYAALPLNIVMGQELVPRHASTVSGLIMGVAWGVGGIAATGLGALADYWAATMGPIAGLSRALNLAPLVPLLPAALAVLLPERPVHRDEINL